MKKTRSRIPNPKIKNKFRCVKIALFWKLMINPKKPKSRPIIIRGLSDLSMIESKITPVESTIRPMRKNMSFLVILNRDCE